MLLDGRHRPPRYTRDSGKCDSDAFVCTEGDETAAQKDFGECMYALDCHMNYNMKSTLSNLT